MPQTLALTNGTLTVNLLGTAAYLREDGWAPAVAARSRSELGNRGDYEAVVEEMTINLFGAAGLSALRDINLLLDEGRRYWLGDPSASAVRLRVQPDNGTLGFVVEAPVYGSEDGAPVQLPRTFHDLLKTNEVDEVTLRFIRGPLWINPTIENVTGTAATSQELHSITLSNHPTRSPVSLAMNVTANVAAVPTASGLIAAGASSAFQLINAEIVQPLSASGNFSVVTNSSARNGQYLRWWTATSLINALDSGGTEITVTLNTTVRTHIFMIARNNADFIGTIAQVAVEPVRLQIDWRNTGIHTTSSYGITTPPPLSTIVDIQGSIVLVYLGSVVLPSGINRARLSLAKTTGSTRRTGLDIDTVIFVNESTGPVEVVQTFPQGISTGPSGGGINLLTITNDPLSQQTPRGGHGTGASPFVIVSASAIDGDLFVQSRGTTFVAFPFALGPSDVWRFDQSNSTNTQIEVRRHRGYLTIE